MKINTQSFKNINQTFHIFNLGPVGSQEPACNIQKNNERRYNFE